MSVNIITTLSKEVKVMGSQAINMSLIEVVKISLGIHMYEYHLS